MIKDRKSSVFQFPEPRMQFLSISIAIKLDLANTVKALCMRRRPSSRLLVLSPDGRLLLFCFAHALGLLAGTSFWATPGGALEPGESFEAAAVRELREEVNPQTYQIGPEIARREFVMELPDGEKVLAIEAYFVVKTEALEPSKALWTPLELALMQKHKWWTQAEIAASAETIYPKDILAIVASVPVP